MKLKEEQKIEKDGKTVGIVVTDRVGGPNSGNNVRLSNKPWVKLPGLDEWLPSAERNKLDTVRWVEKHSLEELKTYYKVHPHTHIEESGN